MAWAMVTEAGTPYLCWAAIAPGATSLINACWAAVPGAAARGGLCLRYACPGGAALSPGGAPAGSCTPGMAAVLVPGPAAARPGRADPPLAGAWLGSVAGVAGI